MKLADTMAALAMLERNGVLLRDRLPGAAGILLRSAQVLSLAEHQY